MCPTLCDPIDGSPPGSPIPGILQARTLEWVAISFSSAWKWSRSVMSDSSRPPGLQPTRLLHPWDFPGKSTGVGCHCLLHSLVWGKLINWAKGKATLHVILHTYLFQTLGCIMSPNINSPWKIRYFKQYNIIEFYSSKNTHNIHLFHG